MAQTQPPSPHIQSQGPHATFPAGNLEDYLAVKAACLADYKNALHHHPSDRELQECAEYLSEWPNVRVMDRWHLGEPEAGLEIAVRYMSGCSTFKVVPEAALNVLDAFHNLSPSSNSGHMSVGPLAAAAAAAASQPERARAHSCAAHAHYLKFTAPDASRIMYASLERTYARREALAAGIGAPVHTSLRFALHHASESARLGLVSAIVLRVGFAAREIAEGLGLDFDAVVRGARRYRPLWRAVDDRVRELYAEARDSCQRVGPSASDECVCGSEGCGMRSKTGALFKACAGRCPLDLKPRYCSKQCQVKDWSRHRAICKPGYGDKIPKIPDKSIALEWFELGEPEPESAPAPASAACEAKSDSPDVPVCVDVQVQGGSPDAKGPQKDLHGSDCNVPVHEDGVGETLNVQDGDGKGVSRDPVPPIGSVSVASTTCGNGVMDEKKADTGDSDRAAQANPRGTAERLADDDAEEVVRLMVTQQVFAFGGDDELQRPWSHRYQGTRRACLFDYRDARHGSPSELEPESTDLARLSSQKVSELWKGPDSERHPAATLEMALRYLAGACTIKCRPNPQAALLVLDAYHKSPRNTRGEHPSASASQAEFARAHALAAYAHYEVLVASDAQRAGWHADFWQPRPAGEGGEGAPRQPAQALRQETQEAARESLTRALHHASEAARLGLVSSIALGLGLTVREIGEGFGFFTSGVDVGKLACRAKRLRSLWRAVDEFLGDLYEQAREALRLEGAAHPGSAGEYVCGLAGCGRRSQVNAKSCGFKACAGKCPPDLKPRYCSKQCQVKDWSRHKKICKPGFVVKIPEITDLRAIALEWFELEEAEPAIPSAVKAQSDPSLTAVPALTADVRCKGDSFDRVADDGKRQHADGAGNSSEAAVKGAVHVQDEVTMCGREDSQDVHDDSDCATPGHATALALTPTARLGHSSARRDGLDRTADDECIQNSDEVARGSTAEAVECCPHRAVGEDQGDAQTTEHATCSPGRSQAQEGEDSLSSPDSESGPLTPVELGGPPRPLVFGCLTPDYMKRMWEEEGPGMWMDSGVWAANPPSVFTARC